MQCVLVSLEDEEATFVDPALRGKYCVCFDPPDGSSNIDCGVSIGTSQDFEVVLQPGTNMLAAGYCMCGSSCTLVLRTGSGVNGFTLDPSLGEFILTHLDIKVNLRHLLRLNYFLFYGSGNTILMTVSFILHFVQILKMGKIYSINEGNAKNWDAAVAKFVEKGKYLKDGLPPKSLRYIGR